MNDRELELAIRLKHLPIDDAKDLPSFNLKIDILSKKLQILMDSIQAEKQLPQSEIDFRTNEYAVERLLEYYRENPDQI